MQGKPALEAPFLIEHREPSVILGVRHPGLDEAGQVRREEGWGGVYSIRCSLPLAPRSGERVAEA
jgi:hypothetical protein